MSTLPCGCCEGIGVETPLPTANRPGLTSLRYRVGTHASFLETMLARLSSSDLPALGGLTTRDRSDPSIALLDAWAMVADVLTFYQERIAQEGYLATATERRSILELARLVGYELRPGVAASVYLAYLLDAGQEVVIDAGSRSQSVPGPGELPQSFETSTPLRAHADFNLMGVRTTRPQEITPDNAPDDPKRGIGVVWLKGTDTKLRTGDAIVFEFSSLDGPKKRFLRLVEAVQEDQEAGRTRVVLQGGSRTAESTVPPIQLSQLFAALLGIIPPAAGSGNGSTPARPFPDGVAERDATLKLLLALNPEAAIHVYEAWANSVVTPAPDVTVYAMRVKAPLFGHNALEEFKGMLAPSGLGLLASAPPGDAPPGDAPPGDAPPPAGAVPTTDAVTSAPKFDPYVPHNEDRKVLWLDNVYEGIVPGSLVATDDADNKKKGVQFALAKEVDAVSRTDYGTSAKVTRIKADGDIWAGPGPKDPFTPIQTTIVYAQSDRLALAEEPLDPVLPSPKAPHAWLELAGLYRGLEPGRLLLLSGERADLGPAVRGVPGAELVRIAAVSQGISTAEEEGTRQGDGNHTLLLLDRPLKYKYVRATLRVYGNVVHATQGESKAQVLGSGDASRPYQAFAIKQPPLTYVSAPTTTGVESTLVVRVNDVRWPLERTLAFLGPTDRGYVTSTDDAGNVTVTFGDGRHGARVPTGIENVRAAFRSGIGKGGNLPPERITQLLSRPLGVRDVTNPMRATGGADPEGRDQARRNAPLPLKALDRLISVQDYADFARTFGGVGKAAAARLTDGRRQLVFVTIAGADDIPLDDTSDVVLNLALSLRRYGDPDLAVRVAVRELLALSVEATVAIDPDYQWVAVERALRAALLDRFSFERRELGQDVSESEVLTAIQTVAGVTSAVLTKLDAVSSRTLLADASTPPPTPAPSGPRRLIVRDIRLDGSGKPAAAQLAYLSPAVPETLVLSPVTP